MPEKKHHDDPEKEERQLEKDIMIEKETIKQYKKKKYQENRKLNTSYQKEKYRENREIQLEYKKSIYRETLKIKIEYQKRRYQENPEVHKGYRKKKYEKYQENKKNWDKVMYFLQEVKQGPYCICTICHRSLYQRSVRLFKQEKYHILTKELCHPVKSFDAELYICETCHKHLNKNEIPCQAVCNKMALYPIPDVLKDLKELVKVLTSKIILFKKGER